MPFRELMERYGIVGVPMLDAQATFSAPARFGDVLQVTSELAEWRNKSLVVSHRICRGDTLCVEGREIRGWVARDDSRPNGLRAVPIPDEIKRRFRR